HTQLDHMSAPGPLPHVVRNAVNFCRRQGSLSRLVFAIAAERPENDDVVRLTQELKLHPAAGRLEALVSENLAMVDVHVWMQRCAVAAARVCQVLVSGSKQGTGFLVGPDAVLTAYHVVGSAVDRLDTLAFRFDYARTPAGEVHP